MKKVLIIDDSSTQLRSLQIMFEREGFEVECAIDGVEGYIKLHTSPVDLIVTDVMMPNLSGFQLTRLLKSDALTKNIPVILLTVLDNKLDNYWGSQSGADSYILKNTDFSELLKCANTLLLKKPVDEEQKKLLRGTKISEENIIERINKILDDSLMKATIVNEFRAAAGYSSKESYFSKKIFSILESIIDYKVCALYFNNVSEKEEKTLYLDFLDINLSPKASMALCEDFFKTLAIKSDSTKWNKVRNDTIDPLLLDDFPKLKSKHIIRFEYEDGLSGAVAFYDTEEKNWKNSRFIKTIEAELEILLKLKILYTRTQYLSITDELTGLYNRRHFEDSLKREFDRCKRYKTKMSVAMIDIDNFKHLNDTYGHRLGDFILSEAASIITKTLRQTDFVYRYGGDEIFIIMPETPIKKTFIPLERLRKIIEEKVFEFEDKKVQTTISIGAAESSYGANDCYSPLKDADSALYKAKEFGRNKVIIHE